jgi:hypothetical protein
MCIYIYTACATGIWIRIYKIFPKYFLRNAKAIAENDGILEQSERKRLWAILSWGKSRNHRLGHPEHIVIKISLSFFIEVINWFFLVACEINPQFTWMNDVMYDEGIIKRPQHVVFALPWNIAWYIAHDSARDLQFKLDKCGLFVKIFSGPVYWIWKQD